MRRWSWITHQFNSIRRHQTLEFHDFSFGLFSLGEYKIRIRRHWCYLSLYVQRLASTSINGPVKSEPLERSRIEEICARLEALLTLAPRPLAIAAGYLLQHQMDTAIYSIIRNRVSGYQQSRERDTHSHFNIFGIDFDIVIKILQCIMPSISQILSIKLGFPNSFKTQLLIDSSLKNG